MDTNIVVDQLCKQHNLPIVYMTQNGPVCVVCLGQKDGMIPLEDFNNNLQNIIQQAECETDNFKQFLVDNLNTILNKKQQVIKQIDLLIQQILDEQNSIDERKKNFKTQIEFLKNNSQGQNEINKLLENLKVELQLNKDIKIKQRGILNNIDNQLIQLINPNIKQQMFQSQINPIFQQQINPDIKQQVFQQQTIQNFQQQKQVEQFQKVTYEEIFKIDCDKTCKCFDFNSQNSILLIGLESDIVIYGLSFGQFKNQIQIINKHENDVHCLQFFRNSDNFISASMQQMIIWNKLQGQNQWVLKQQLFNKSHLMGSNFLLNKSQNLLFTGQQLPDLNCNVIASPQIIIWKFKDDGWQVQNNLLIGRSHISAFSLNETEDTLILSESTDLRNAKILVYTLSNNQWPLKQRIKAPQEGYRLAFTVGNQFVFQPKSLDYLSVYDNANNEEFLEVQKIKIQNCVDCTLHFPCQFIKSSGILTVKHGQYLNIFKLNKFGKFDLIQTIQFKDEKYQYGKMSDNGQFLVTWDQGDQQIKMRQLKYYTKVFQ